MKSVKILIEGVLRGTGFKAHVYTLARRLGLKGYITDVDEGRELICIEDGEEQVREFLSSIDRGPPFTIINSVAVLESDEPCNSQGFKIYYREF